MPSGGVKARGTRRVTTQVLRYRIAAIAVATSILATPARADPPTVPVALAWGSDGALRVALREARQIVSIDPASWNIVGSRDLPFRPASLALASDKMTLLIGGADGDLAAIDSTGMTFSIRGSTGRGWTRVLPLAGSKFAAASRWQTAVDVFDLPRGRLVRSIPLTFPPGMLVRRPDGRLIVADAFGGRLASVDPETGAVTARLIDGVNVRALAISGDGNELLLAHTTQDDTVPITPSNIDAGLVVSSRLSSVRLSDFDHPNGASMEPLPSRRIALDGPRHGAADPSAMAVSRDGAVVLVALAGSHQLLKNDRTLGLASSHRGLRPLGHNQGLATLEVGRTPLDVTISPTGEFAVTANAMSDTLTVARVADLSWVATVRLGPESPAQTAEQRGEALFHDARLALDRWMTCATCHPAGHTSGLNFDTLSDGGYGAPKNTPSLLGVGATAPYAWTGRFATLSEQVHESLRTSLRGEGDHSAPAADLSAYLGSLTPPPPRRAADEPAVLRGAAVFRERRCDSCHAPPQYTSAGAKGVGLDDGAGGHRAFNAPTLRGVGWTAPFLHDGRLGDLDAVLKIHPPGGSQRPLEPNERGDLQAFLESL